MRRVMCRSDGAVDLWWDLKGDGPVLVLLPGRGDSSDLFPMLFCDRLIEVGISVLRMDPRDTGLSGSGGDSYTLTTMAEDVVNVLDAAGVRSAHVIGVSMGGMILVDLVSRFPSRVASAGFIAAMSSDPAAGIGEQFFAALGADPVEATLAAMGSPNLEDRDWVISEQKRATERAETRPDARRLHQHAAFRFGWPELECLSEIDVPVLVIHGTADQVLPVAHAQAFAREVPGAELTLIEGKGHLPTRAEWEVVATLAIDHVERACATR